LLLTERIREYLDRDDLCLEARPMRTSQGFDALLALTGSTASADL
jgi:hypothetical protein